ncbi:MAG TPA: peptidoglycan-binding domain-containing protein [Chthoniobacterales bacterium]
MKTFSVSRRVVFAAILTLTTGIAASLMAADISRGNPFRQAQAQRQQVIERTQNFRRDSNRGFDNGVDRYVDRKDLSLQRQIKASQVQREEMIEQTRDFRRNSNWDRNLYADRRKWDRDNRRRDYHRDWDRGGRHRYYYDSRYRYPRYRYYGNRRYYGGYWGYPYYTYGWGPWWGPSFGVTVGGIYPYGGYYDGRYYDEDVRIYRGEQVSPGYDTSISFAVQRKLAKLGYYSGPIDGDIGPASRRAIRRYQSDNDLEVTGRIDRNLIASLRIL